MARVQEFVIFPKGPFVKRLKSTVSFADFNKSERVGPKSPIFNS
jgi:hypothetical protein